MFDNPKWEVHFSGRWPLICRLYFLGLRIFGWACKSCSSCHPFRIVVIWMIYKHSVTAGQIYIYDDYIQYYIWNFHSDFLLFFFFFFVFFFSFILLFSSSLTFYFWEKIRKHPNLFSQKCCFFSSSHHICSWQLLK